MRDSKNTNLFDTKTELEPSYDKKPEDAGIKPQNPDPGYRAYPDPMYPALFPGLNPDEQMNRGAGIYAVHVHQFGGHIAGLPSNYLIPLTYNVPTTRPSNETEAGGENQAQTGPGQQQQQLAHQRQVVVRRFEIAFQLDIFLILKLAAVIFLFNQDGSKQRLTALVIFATIIYFLICMEKQGTRIVIYNLWEDNEGKLKLHFSTNRHANITLKSIVFGGYYDFEAGDNK